MADLEIVFWGCAALLVYVYLGYPALVWAWARLRPRRDITGREEPTVTIVVAAYNEERRIRPRLGNLLALDYPRDRLEILVVSDGSTDATATLAEEYGALGVVVIARDRRQGKPTALNEAVPKCHGEIVVFADARQSFDSGALRALVAHFADPQVGVVSGGLTLVAEGKGGVSGGVSSYWKYEKFVRFNEGRVDSTVGVTGAIYAIRRDLFEPIPPDTILDDVLIPMRVVRRGHRVLFESTALAYDRASTMPGEEWTRKVRTIAGTFQLFSRERWLLDPFRNRLWLQTVSHKALRLTTPLLLLGVFAANLLLLGRSPYNLALVAQSLFYGAALAAGLGVRHRLLTFQYVLCLLNWATVVAFCRFATGRQGVTWERAEPLTDLVPTN
jgi:poly-beta-1,6-N-acetyl-D-glucosamine synthase